MICQRVGKMVNIMLLHSLCSYTHELLCLHSYSIDFSCPLVMCEAYSTVSCYSAQLGHSPPDDMVLSGNVLYHIVSLTV